MFALFLTTIITCSQASKILNRIQSNGTLSEYVKIELLEQIRETTPTCPVKIKEDGRNTRG